MLLGKHVRVSQKDKVVFERDALLFPESMCPFRVLPFIRRGIQRVGFVRFVAGNRPPIFGGSIELPFLDRPEVVVINFRSVFQFVNFQSSS